jgi:hypothetical protein
MPNRDRRTKIDRKSRHKGRRRRRSISKRDRRCNINRKRRYRGRGRRGMI